MKAALIIALTIASGLFATEFASAQTSEKASILERGEYLTRAADCEACHTVEGSQPYIGGRPFTLPFGVIYSPNITPDIETGIGSSIEKTWKAVFPKHFFGFAVIL